MLPFDNHGPLSSPPFDAPVPPLNFGDLISNPEYAHIQLMKTVDDLSQLLSVVEAGLAGMLDGLGTDIIKEEQEDSTSPLST